MTLPDSVELKDGSAHGMPCPAERHEGDGEAPMLSVQFFGGGRGLVVAMLGSAGLRIW